MREEYKQLLSTDAKVDRADVMKHGMKFEEADKRTMQELVQRTAGSHFREQPQEQCGLTHFKIKKATDAESEGLIQGKAWDVQSTTDAGGASGSQAATNTAAKRRDQKLRAKERKRERTDKDDANDDTLSTITSNFEEVCSSKIHYIDRIENDDIVGTAI